MSLLLEALQRADSERKNQGDVPGIDTQHSVAIKTEPENSHHWILIALALIILLLLAYVIYRLSTDTKPEITPLTVDSLSVQNDALSQADQPNRPAEQTSVPLAESPAVDAEVSSDAKATQAEVAALYKRLKAENSSDVAAKRTDHAEQIVAVQTKTGIEERFAEENDEQDEEIDQQNAAEEVYSSIPFASQLPEHQQSRIPSLRYTTHGYAKETGRGLVTLNGRTQRRGDTIASGLVLLDIRADYIVLDMNGVLFRLPAATDWN